VRLFNRIIIVVLTFSLSLSVAATPEIVSKKEIEQEAPTQCWTTGEVVWVLLGIGTLAFCYGRWVGFRSGYLKNRWEGTYAALQAESNDYISLFGQKTIIHSAIGHDAKANVEAILRQVYAAGQKAACAKLE